MASFDSDVMAGQSNISVRQRIEGQRVTGDIRVCEATYTTTATEATGDLIRWFVMPIGGIIFPEKCWFFSEGIGGTSVILTSFGDEGDNARYATNDIAVTAASTVVLPPTPLVAGLLSRYVVVAASVNIVSAMTGTLPVTINKKIVGHFEYRMP